MKAHQPTDFNSSAEDASYENLPFFNNEVKTNYKIVQISNTGEILSKAEPFLVNDETAVTKEVSISSNQNLPELFRLVVKNGEYVYAKAHDIIMIESCDHLVKVYVAIGGKIKKTIRHNTLKDFLSQLPLTQFVRIGRFCAVNIDRLSGGNSNEQTFEFDFNLSIKLAHSVSHTVFARMGK